MEFNPSNHVIKLCVQVSVYILGIEDKKYLDRRGDERCVWIGLSRGALVGSITC
jgi:hypothetical protein